MGRGKALLVGGAETVRVFAEVRQRALVAHGAGGHVLVLGWSAGLLRVKILS